MPKILQNATYCLLFSFFVFVIVFLFSFFSHFCYCLLRTMIEEKSGLSVLPKSRFEVLIIIIFRRKFISLIDKTLYSRLNSKRMRNNGGAIPRRKTFDWVVGQMENFLVDVESWRLFQKNMFWIILIIGWLLREYIKIICIIFFVWNITFYFSITNMFSNLCELIGLLLI